MSSPTLTTGTAVTRARRPAARSTAGGSVLRRALGVAIVLVGLAALVVAYLASVPASAALR